MSNNQEENGNETEVDSSTIASANTATSPLGNEAGVAPDDVAETVPFAEYGAISKSKAIVPSIRPATLTLSFMHDVPIPLVFEVGRTTIPIAHLMELRQGSFIDLRNVSVDVIDVLVDDEIVAEAEAISLRQRYAVRISEITRIHIGEDPDDAS